ncbi:MAG: formate dehydrogenase accessory sulfurtransferase FdhD, partial [Acidobacteriota bacterium]|nr:formate dehydrogenase accessory sulfurtransferase FdhD [Acidobacteriota bacterium]
TPGNDFELAAGFLFTEGVIRYADDIEEIGYAPTGSDTLLPESERRERVCNTVRVRLQTDVTVAVATLARNFFTTSSCGVCGKASLLALEAVCPQRVECGFTVDVDLVRIFPQRLKDAQTVFARTGGLHGAGLFTANGDLLHVREDVGRHNAVDKLVGEALLRNQLPLRDSILMLSGRISFELAQKAVMAGIPMIVAVGAPSSLAIRVAERFGMAMAGFVRGERLNIYNGAEYFTGF